MAKNNKRKSNYGWARTKKYPHERHPANYARKVEDNIEYITFTHSPEVKHDGKNMPPKSILDNIPKGHIRYDENGNMYVRTIPMLDNVSKKERTENKRKGLKVGENRSYAYPVVFVGKRSALHSTIVGEFEPVPFDNARIKTMFAILPRTNVPVTGGKGQYKKQQKKKPRR